MRISDDPLAYSYGSILGPIWPPVPQFFFCLILPEFCDFSGVLYLRYLIFLRMRFLQKFWVLATFLVFWWFSNSFGTLGPKMDKTYNFGCVPFDLKFKILKDFPNTVPYWRLPLVKISARSKKPQETQKEAISWMLNQYEKLWNFPFQSNCYTGEIYHRLYILIKSFIWQNLGV